MFIPYRLADGSTVMVEVTEETAAYLFESNRELENVERRERYHCPYHLEAMPYEDESIAYRDTPEEILIRKEERDEIADALSVLTESQYRRLLMKADGMTLREIARIEGTSVNAVRDSLLQARKKLNHLKKEF